MSIWIAASAEGPCPICSGYIQRGFMSSQATRATDTAHLAHPPEPAPRKFAWAGAAVEPATPGPPETPSVPDPREPCDLGAAPLQLQPPAKRKRQLGQWGATAGPILLIVTLVAAATVAMRYGGFNYDRWITMATAVVVNEPDDEAAARSTLERFLAARQSVNKLLYVLEPERLGERMSQYYAGHPPEGIGIESFTRDRSDERQLDGDVVLLAAESSAGRILALFKRGVGASPKLDWETFIQTKDQTFRKFIDEPKSEPQTFLVLIRRCPDTAVETSISNAVCVTVSCVSSPSREIGIALDRGSRFGSLLASSLEIGQSRHATVKLRWTGEEGRPLSIAFEELVSWGLLGG